MASLGQYELIREIGEGGMATVYEAMDQRIGRHVALKVLTLPLYLSQVQRRVMIDRLMREARAAGRLSHPNIVTLFDVGEDGGHHYIAMEYLDGQSLRGRLEEGSLSLPEAAHILEGVAAGLDHAHAHGVLHRDIKPSNVMLLPDGRVKLTDFGVARHADDPRLTQTGVPVGSPAYMAPEQVRGEPATAASDRWSLGVLLYEMLSGHPPFTGDSVPVILHQVAYNPVPRLPGAARGVQAVLDRALARDPGRRYGSALDMAADFRNAIGKAAASPARPRRVLPAPEPAISGSKGGEVAARPAPAHRRPGWAWVVPLAALLVALPFLLLRPSHQDAGGSPASTARTSAPHVSRSSSTARERPGPARLSRIEVTEVTPRPAPDAAPRRSAVTKARPASPVDQVVRRRSVRARTQPQPPRRLAAASRVQPRAMRRAHVEAAQPRAVRRAQAEAARPRRRAQVEAPPRPRRRSEPIRTAARHDSPVVQTVLRPEPERRRPRRVATAEPPRTRISKRTNVRALDARAYRLLRQGRPDAAEPLLREAVRRNPNYAYAQYNLGWSLLSQGKAREAVAPLRRTAAQQPNRWEPQHRLAQAYARMGDHEKAREAAARAQALRRGRSRRG